MENKNIFYFTRISFYFMGAIFLLILVTPGSWGIFSSILGVLYLTSLISTFVLSVVHLVKIKEGIVFPIFSLICSVCLTILLILGMAILFFKTAGVL